MNRLYRYKEVKEVISIKIMVRSFAVFRVEGFSRSDCDAET